MDQRHPNARIAPVLEVHTFSDDPFSYFYYVGILTHERWNVSAVDSEELLRIPNLITLRTFAKEYVKVKYETEGSAERFVQQPTTGCPTTISRLCAKRQGGKFRWTLGKQSRT